MFEHSPFQKYKLNNVPFSNRYKTRSYRGSNQNFNIRPIKQIRQKIFHVEQEYSPLNINSRPLQSIKAQSLKNQTKRQIENSQQKNFIDDIRKLYVNAKNVKNLPKIPIISTPIFHTQNLISQETQKQRINTQKQKKATITRPYHSQSKSKRCTCGNCQDCMKDFTHYLQMISNDNSIPQISAKSWCIWRMKNDKFYYYYGKRIHKVRQIASLTKIITAMIMIDYVEKYNLDINKVKYIIRKSSVIIGGTTAKLNVGQTYTLKELLFGMMLPSGNDCAIAISQAISLMINLKNKNKKFDPHEQDWCVQYSNKNYAYLFIAAMNQKVQKIGTLDTRFFNSHGNDAYDQLKNISTCNQIAKISSQFLKYPLLRQVVKTTQFTFQNGTVIQNTNKLLEDGFEGIKTGITDTAGPCLAAYYKDLIIVVLNSKSMNQRWIQVKKLVKWIRNKV